MSQFEDEVIALHNSHRLDTVMALPRFNDAHPTPDHLMPFIICYGLAEPDVAVRLEKTYQPGLSSSVVCFGVQHKVYAQSASVV